MKTHLHLFLILAIPAFSTHASAAQIIPAGAQNIGSWTVTDTNEPPDLVTFSSNGQFIITPTSSSGRVIAQGVYRRDGSGLVMTISNGSGFGPRPYSGGGNSSGDFSFLNQILDMPGETPAFATNGQQIVPSGPLIVGGSTNFNATVTDNGNSIVILSDSGSDFNNLLQGSGGSIVLGAGGGSDNNGNGSGTPSGPPGGGSGDPPSVVPEPSTWAMLVLSLTGLLFFRRFRFGRR